MTKVTINPDKLTRIEVVGDNGRELVRYFKSCYLSIQDDGCTLKFMISNNPKQRLVSDEQDELPAATD